MTDATIPGPVWIPLFLASLRKTRRVMVSIEAAGVNPRTVYFQKHRNMRFAEAWQAALGCSTPVPPPVPPPTRPPAPPPVPVAPKKRAAGKARAVPAAAPPPALNGGWRTAFLEQLTHTSNVRAAAAHANVPITTVYALKQRDPAFAVKWRKALFEGYEQLEVEVLACLRGNLPDRKIDIAHAIRQLAAHRKTVAEMRCVEEVEDEEAVIASIDALIDRMRGSTGPDNPKLLAHQASMRGSAQDTDGAHDGI